MSFNLLLFLVCTFGFDCKLLITIKSMRVKVLSWILDTISRQNELFNRISSNDLLGKILIITTFWNCCKDQLLYCILWGLFHLFEDLYSFPEVYLSESWKTFPTIWYLIHKNDIDFNFSLFFLTTTIPLFCNSLVLQILEKFM